MCHSLRSMGSAALNIAMVASGGLDMYWEIGVSGPFPISFSADLVVLALGCLREPCVPV